MILIHGKIKYLPIFEYHDKQNAGFSYAGQ